MNLNICQCGSQSGYPHAEDCPYPYYGSDKVYEAKWVKDRIVLQFTRKYHISPEVVKLARINEWFDLVDEQGNQIELPAEIDEITESQLTQLAPDLGWVCGKCKTHNADGVLLCGFCDTPRLSG